MRRASTVALDRALDSWQTVLADHRDDVIAFGNEIFALREVLADSAALSRSLTDPARSSQARADLARDVFGSKVSGPVMDLVTGLVRERIDSPAEVLEIMQRAGVETLLISAHLDGRLDQVEEELYRTLEILSDERELRATLQDGAIDLERRQDLVAQVFSSCQAETVALLRQAVARTDDETLVVYLRYWIELCGQLGKHLIAIVTAAHPLEHDQEQRLADLLERKYSRPVQLHIGIDPSVLGGLRVRVGNDIIDGTLSSRLNDVKSVFSDK